MASPSPVNGSPVVVPSFVKFPVVITSPFTFGNLIILSPVGSTTFKVVSKAFSNSPSNTRFEPLSIISFVVILPLVTSCKITEPAPPNSLTRCFVI